MRKICVVITARASYSRIKTALIELEKNPSVNLMIVLAGSSLIDKYGDIRGQLSQDNLKVTAEAYHVVDGGDLISSAKTVGLGINELSSIFVQLKPDLVVTIADRFETMSTAVAASFMNIPLAHIQGGEVTGNIDEKVRHSITKLADLHLVSTEKSKERVIKMGENPDCVHVTGCPSIDIAHQVASSGNNILDFDPIKKYGGVGPELDWSNWYIVVMQHPVTTEFHLAEHQILETLKAVCEIKIPAFWFWPNLDAGTDGTSKGIRKYREQNLIENIHFFKNMDSVDFLKLLKNSVCLIGNSSVGLRECSYLGVPCINIGNRQFGRERSSNILNVDHSTTEILQAFNKVIDGFNCSSSTLYGDGNAGPRISKILADSKLSFNKHLNY